MPAPIRTSPATIQRHDAFQSLVLVPDAGTALGVGVQVRGGAGEAGGDVPPTAGLGVGVWLREGEGLASAGVELPVEGGGVGKGVSAGAGDSLLVGRTEGNGGSRVAVAEAVSVGVPPVGWRVGVGEGEGGVVGIGVDDGRGGGSVGLGVDGGLVGMSVGGVTGGIDGVGVGMVWFGWLA